MSSQHPTKDEINAGERIYLGATELEEIDLKQHSARYNFAKQFLTKRDRLLDAACGSGYGCDILADEVSDIVGLDISEHALSWARDNYKKTNVEFRTANLNEPLLLDDESFDRITSFETIEHLANQELLIQQFKRILKPEGVLIISCPNQAFSDLVERNNPFHTKEFYPMEFLDFLQKHYSQVEVYGQTRVQGISKSVKMARKILGPIVPTIKQIFETLGLRKLGSHFRVAQESPENFERIQSEPKVIYQNLLAVCRK
jgi:ubiquinone/menaquinone biosynthesis C-methylase UbiE